MEKFKRIVLLDFGTLKGQEIESFTNSKYFLN